MRAAATLLAAVLSLVALPAGAACRQALALGLDVSGSVDSREYALQLGGLAGALGHPDVRAALLQMPGAPVRLAVYEWSGPGDQPLILDWTKIDSAAALDSAIARIAGAARQARSPSTALGDAMRRGAAMLAGQAACWRRTLDISGDGKSNTGPRPQDVQASGLLSGITVNGLVIGADSPATGDARQVEIGELGSYYRAYVIHGPDAFIETAIGFEDFEAAMTRKLLRELEGLAIGALGVPGTAPLRTQ